MKQSQLTQLALHITQSHNQLKKNHEENHLIFHMTTNHSHFNTMSFIQNPLKSAFTYIITIHIYEKEIQHMRNNIKTA